MRFLGYCLVPALFGVIVWGALAVWPLSRDLLMRPGYLDSQQFWEQQLVALALAASITAVAFRPAIRRVEKPWHYLLVASLAILTGSVAAGVLLAALPELVAFVMTGSTSSPPGCGKSFSSAAPGASCRLGQCRPTRRHSTPRCRPDPVSSYRSRRCRRRPRRRRRPTGSS